MLYDARLFLLYNNVKQQDVHIYLLPLELPPALSILLGHHRALSELAVLCSSLPLVIWFIHGGVYMSVLLSVDSTIYSPNCPVSTSPFFTSVSRFLPCKACLHMALKHVPLMLISKFHKYHLTYLLSLIEKLLELVVKVTVSSFPLFILFLTPSKELCVHSIETTLIQVPSGTTFCPSQRWLLSSSYRIPTAFGTMTTPSLIRPCLFQAVVTQNIVSQTPHQRGLLTDPLFTRWMWEKFFSILLTALPWLIALKYHSSTDGP